MNHRIGSLATKSKFGEVLAKGVFGGYSNVDRMGVVAITEKADSE